MPDIEAPAKLNLTLEVLSRRPDGYHTLRSVMVPIGIYDRIAFGTSAGAESSLAVTFGRANGDANGLGPARDNLLLRALRAAGVAPRAVRLEKNIPIGGGLGGGSSDAAAALRAASSGALGASHCDDWLAAARSLGSDVPFFLTGTAALVEGTGERVTALGSLPEWWSVVVRPPVAVATAEAYRLLDESRAENDATSRPRAESVSLRAVDALQRADFATLARELHNDFHEPVLAAFPEIARAAEALRAACGAALLSGSGSCLFALFESEAEAHAAAARIDASAGETFVAPFHRDGAWR